MTGPDRKSFLGHLFGERLGEVRHMCPECGALQLPLCPVCLGVGDVSEARLARWVAETNRQAGPV